MIVTCPLCLYVEEIADFKPFIVATDNVYGGMVDYYKCKNCDLVYLLTPPPTEVYNEDYAKKYQINKTTQEYRTNEARELAKILRERYGEGYIQTLEIGCGDGTFSGELVKQGIEARVSDINPFSVKMAEEKGCVGVSTESIIGDGAYDAGIMVHTLEHFDMPQTEFSRLIHAIRGGGIIYIHTPNADHFRDSRWFHATKEHVRLFGRKTLRMLFEKNGVTVIGEKQLYGDDLIMWGVV